ncbi:MAG TPA: cyclase dehydrase [Microvirga sp.]|nr:cyclase dehydrase [Microvirga sp.]
MAHHRTHSRSKSSADALARGLGWFSIGLGILEVAAPHRLTRALGMRGQENIIRAYGWREIANGVGILAARNPAPWVWGRVGGDALDLATLAGGFDENNRRRENVGLAMAAVAGVTALDVYCATALSADRHQPTRRQPVRDYTMRSGLPRPPEQMRGAASDFVTPPDMRSALPTPPREPARPAMAGRT